MTLAERSDAWLSSPARVVAAIVTLVLAAFSATGFLAVRTLESHTPTGTTAQVSLGRLDGDAVVVVHDEGPGISPEAAAQAFDRFYRSERSRSRSNGGSGLGLSIVRSIVEAHGGTATLTSELGTGTTTTITLPASPDSNGADPK